jgi:release factor glutamine methyltransferase
METQKQTASTDEVWTIKRVLAWAKGDLEKHGSSSPRLDAELMLAQVLVCDRIRLVIDADRPLVTEELTAYRGLHKRRRSGEPVAYLRGYRDFYKHRFVVDERVLVPRPETELLVETACRRSAHLSLCARVLDLCTGSGCVAITIKKLRPNNLVLASDMSVDALDVAKLNSVCIGALVGLIESDVYDNLSTLRGKLDVITANPPYIGEAEMQTLPRDVRDFEPHAALVAGADGLAVTRRIVVGAPSMLAPGGVLALEVMAGQAPAVAQLMADADLLDVKIEADYAGLDRIVSARATR